MTIQFSGTKTDCEEMMNTLCLQKDPVVNKKTQKSQELQNKIVNNVSTDEILKHENESLKKALDQLKVDFLELNKKYETSEQKLRESQAIIYDLKGSFIFFIFKITTIFNLQYL